MYPETEIFYQTGKQPDCLCGENDDTLEIDVKKRTVRCSVCKKTVSNWLIRKLISIYEEDIDDEVEAEIKSYFYIHNVEAEERSLSKMADFLKHK